MAQGVVTHPVFGEGAVLDSRRQGHEVLVQFRTGLRIWVPARRVALLPECEPHLDEIAARRMVEAFRLGIVPLKDVESFTFGRELELKQAEDGLERLRQGLGDVLLVEGDYGAGKTHLLEHIHHQALARGMVVSRVEFDPVDVAPNRPKRVYRELVHNLRWITAPGADARHVAGEHGFRDLLQLGCNLPMDDHVFFQPVLRKLARPAVRRHRHRNADVLAEVFWQMIEGESTKEYAVQSSSPYRIAGGQAIPALYDFSTAGDFYCYIISGLSHICRELGLHGLVLLIDEAETVTHLWDIIAFTRGMSFIEGLIRTANNDPELKKIDSRLVHNRVRTTPYIYRDARIFLVIATTPQPHDYTYLKMTNYARNRLGLARLGDRALGDAFARLIAVYRQAYPGFELPENEQQRLREFAFRRKGEGTRHFVKLCVEALDLRRTVGQQFDPAKARAALWPDAARRTPAARAGND
jgi:hypothetical protein